MTRYVAFLGGINVGGHRVTMGLLRAEFEALGFTDASTFIASGNVIFAAAGKAAPLSVLASVSHTCDDLLTPKRGELELRIEAHLAEQLGYPVPTFLRTTGAVRKVAALAPFGTIADGDTHLVAFLRRAPTASAKQATEALSNDQDRFEVHGTELHWLVHGGVTDSSVKSSVLARALGQPSTTRNTRSLRKLAAKLRG